ncbi:MAG: glycosyltransferase family 4 protein [Candidatus Zambryskibacteria bacterium]|nr:glycosyltransferase family 4 protein [Candidatus Zambryskibacteria bacterium]
MLKDIFSKPYSKLFIVGDNSGWSTDDDAKDLKNFAVKLGVPVEIVKRMYLNLPQAVHYTSQFSLLLDNIYKSKNRISVDYYHGNPETQESFRKCFEALKSHQDKITQVRVSNSDMERLIKSIIDPIKVMRIPLGIDTSIFMPQTAENKLKVRREYGIPENTVVIGSFQKDGVGWGEGFEPKPIKGPDIFLKVIEKLKNDVPNLWVLLSGPSRGYVKSGLEKLGIPYRHKYFKESSYVSDLYDALDLYLITSREEGGPKSCLQSMAKGVPLVTTAVGQCKDLVISGENAMMAPIDDVSGLYALSLQALRDQNLREKLINKGLKTVRGNSFDSQLPLWREYLRKLIDG